MLKTIKKLYLLQKASVLMRLNKIKKLQNVLTRTQYKSLEVH